MIKIENVEVVGLEPSIRGMRNPKNSWDKIDSSVCAYSTHPSTHHCKDCEWSGMCNANEKDLESNVIIGDNDHDLMSRLAKGGPVHAKYRRMIVVYLDIVAPLYWWKEFDTYKVGTVANSCSTMHKIHDKEFTLEDFSCEHLVTESIELLEDVINKLNKFRAYYNDYDKKNVFYIDNDQQIVDKKVIWEQMIQLLPSSYNQRRTIMLNYEVLAGLYPDRKNHKLDEWKEFCKWIESLPYSEIITCTKPEVKINYKALVSAYQAIKNNKLEECEEFCNWIESLPGNKDIVDEEDQKKDIPERIECPTCNGKGSEQYLGVSIWCRTCGGKGTVRNMEE